MPDFDRLYLDTTILRKSNWPHVSAELGFLLELARNFAIEILIPEPVEIEREEQWIRELGAASQKWEAATAKRSDVLKAVGGGLDEQRADQPDAFRERYKTAAQLVKEANGIKTVPMTTRSPAEFFRLAVTRTPPFQIAGDKITGFQDATILLSIVDDLIACGKPSCALLSEDDVFSKIGAVSQSEGKTIRHLRTIEDVWKILSEEIRPELVKWWEQQRAAIKVEVAAQQEQISQLIGVFVTPDMIDYRARTVESVGLPRLISVDIPFPRFPLEPGPYPTREGTTHKISATLFVEVRALASRGLGGFAALLSGQFLDRSGAKAAES